LGTEGDETTTDEPSIRASASTTSGHRPQLQTLPTWFLLLRGRHPHVRSAIGSHPAAGPRTRALARSRRSSCRSILLARRGRGDRRPVAYLWRGCCQGPGVDGDGQTGVWNGGGGDGLRFPCLRPVVSVDGNGAAFRECGQADKVERKIALAEERTPIGNHSGKNFSVLIAAR